MDNSNWNEKYVYNAQSSNGSLPGGGDDNPPGGGDNPPGGGDNPPGEDSSDVTWSGATEITSDVSQSNQTYTSTVADENALLINTSEGTYFQNATVEKTGDSDGGDNCNFYGINSAIMVMGGGTATIDGGTVTANATGANGIFSYGGNGGTNGAAGDGTTVVIQNTQITTTGDNAGGFMTTGGGITYANNLTVETSGQSSAAIRTDRGGGTVSVEGGTYTSNGLGSPAVYSTANISISNAILTSNKSEGICIEGENSVALTDCTLTANNTQTNGNATFLDSIMIYQSQSGDAADGTSTFSMSGGSIISQNGHVFHVTNTNAVINLNNVSITNNDANNILLSVSDDGWSGDENVATLNADNQTLTGDILVGVDSTLTLNIANGSVFSGNISGDITNAAGQVVSSLVGEVSVSLDDSSKWFVTEDVYLDSFSGNPGNVFVDNSDVKVYVNSLELEGVSIGQVDALDLINGDDNTIVSGSDFNDTINNTGNNVTIQGGDGDDSIQSGGNDVSISGGEGNDFISLSADSANVTIQAGAGNDTLIGADSSTYIDGAFTAQSLDGSNAILASDNGSLTIIDAPLTLNINGVDTLADTLAASVADYALKIISQEAKYPAMALDYFNPTEDNPDEPALAASSDTMTITSADDLQLSGVHFAPENPTDNWVILVHGYGKDHRAMNGFVDNYLLNGYNVLAIDQRAAGDSEGEYLTMGVAESQDLALWTKAVADINPDARITLHGVSMGAATVMLAAANSDTANLAAVVEDCGYTDVRDVFINLVADSLGVDDSFVDSLYNAAQFLTGYDLNNAAPINFIAEVNAPTLFINGDSDTVVPASMAEELYNAATAEKDLLIVEGASHAEAFTSNDYAIALFSFIGDDFILPLAQDDSFNIDGVTFSAIEDSIVNFNSDGKVTGITSGTVEVTTDNDSALINGVNYSGNVTLTADSIILSAGSTVSNAGDNSFTVFNSGTYAIDGQTFNLADDIDSGLTLTNTDSGFISSRVISASEVDNEVIFDSDVGKVFTENVTVTGDEAYSINLGVRGISELGNISSGATVSISGVFDGVSDYSLVDIVTDSEGEFTFGDTTYTITGDDNVDLQVRFESDGTVAVTNIKDLDGTIYGDNISAVMSLVGAVNINDKTFALTENVASGVTITSGDSFSVAHKTTADDDFVENVQIVGDEVYSVSNDSEGINEISGISTGASITVGASDDSGTDFNIKTDSEGEFTFGDTTYTITGDDSVELSVHFNNDGTAEIIDVNDLEGYISGNGSVIGAYEIDNSESNVVEGSKFNDTINNSGGNATINALGGNDIITNTDASGVYIDAGDGDDTIITAGDNLTLDAGAGNDSIVISDSNNQLIDAGDGDDTIITAGDNLTLDAGAGNDSIVISDSNNQLIDAGDGDDTIITAGNNLTLNAGAGNNFVSINGSAQISVDTGDNTISGYTSDVTIHATAVESSSAIGNNLLLNTARGVITILDGVSQAINLVDDDGNFTSEFYIGEVPISDSGVINGVEYTGEGSVSLNNGEITLSGSLAVETEQDIVIAGGSNITIGGKVFEVTGSAATVSASDDGFIVNGEEITVSGDGEYSILIENGEFTGLTDLSAGATVVGDGEYSAVTDERGSYTFGDNTYTIFGDDNVLFEIDNNSVKSVSALEGTISGSFSGIGVNDNIVSVQGNVIAAEDTLTITGSNSAEFTMTAAGAVNIGTRAFELTSDVTVAVSINDSSVAVGSESVTIAGDRTYTVQGSVSDIDQVIGLTGGASVSGVGEYTLETDSQGNFTFDKAYSIAGDNSVAFSVNNGSVTGIDSVDVAATVSGEIAGVSINGGLVEIAGDSSVAVVNTSSGLDIRNVSADATVQSAVGAYRVTTDEEGAFDIIGAKVTVTGDRSVIFNIDSVVTGVSNVENATVAVDGDEVTLAFNGAETINYHSNSNGEIVISSSVNSVSGVDSVSGLNNATVHATSAVTVNDVAVNVSVDNDYDVVVAAGDVVSIKNINSNSTLTVNNVGVQVVEEGAYTFGAKTYEIVEDSEVNFSVNGAGEVENISGLTGGVVASEAFNASINGVDIKVSDSSATIYGGTRGISNIDGLSSNSTVESSAINNILIAVGNGTLTANDIVYELAGDGNGAYITGRVIRDLDLNASLKVDTAATYTVNGSVLNANVGDIIIGASDGSAYIYDPENIRIESNTSTADIIEQLGVEGGYAYSENNSSAIDRLIESGNLDGNMALNIGNGVQNSVDFSESSGRKLASVTGGAHNISFNDAGDNIAVIDSNVANAENITLGDGGDIVVVEETSARVSIVGGEGADTIISKGDNVIFDMESGGADRVVANAGSIELENYSDSTGAGVQTNYSNIVNAITSGALEMGSEGVTLSNAEVKVNSAFINLYNTNAELQKVGYSDGGTLNGSTIKADVVLIGEGASTVIGGSGADTVLAGEGVVVDAGSGNNYVLLDSETNRGGATIQMTATSGRTTVDNFKATFDDGDMVNANSDATITFDGSDITVKSGRNRVILNDVGASDSADEADDFGAANSAQILIGNSRKATKTEVVAEGAAVMISDEVADIYIGKNSGLDLSGYDGRVNINLETGRGSIDNDAATFTGFNRIRAGSGANTLYGSSSNEMIYAGVSGATIDGNGGRDTLIGYSGDDKESGTLFRANSGKATIEGFEFFNGDNDETADKINTYNQLIEDLRASDSDLTVTTANGRLVIVGGAGKDIKYSREGVDLIAQVNNDELIFDGTANYYEATGKNATIKVDDGLDSAEVWLDNSNLNQADFEGDIKYLDASALEGEATLVGNSNNNVITASKSDSSLWGGANGNDTLIGGDGEDMFWYFYGNGNDSISGADNHDVVNLADVTFDMFDVNAIEIGANSIKVNFHDGGSVALDTNDETTFKLGDGSSWVYDKDDSEWKSKS